MREMVSEGGFCGVFVVLWFFVVIESWGLWGFLCVVSLYGLRCPYYKVGMKIFGGKIG